MKEMEEQKPSDVVDVYNTYVIFIHRYDYTIPTYVRSLFERLGTIMELTPSDVTSGAFSTANHKTITAAVIIDNIDIVNKYKSKFLNYIPLLSVLSDMSERDYCYKRGAVAVISIEELERDVETVTHIVSTILYRNTMNDAKSKGMWIMDHSFADVHIDMGGNTLSICNHEIHLTDTEGYIYKILAENRGKWVPVKTFIDFIWGGDVSKGRTFDVHVSHLRKYLQEDPRFLLERSREDGLRLTFEE